MNITVNEEFHTSCQIFGERHVYIARLPSENLVINNIFAIAFNSILIIPMLLLNTVAVITLLKLPLLKKSLAILLFYCNLCLI